MAENLAKLTILKCIGFEVKTNCETLHSILTSSLLYFNLIPKSVGVMIRGIGHNASK